VSIIEYADAVQQSRAQERAVIRQEELLEEAAGLALQDLLNNMTAVATGALTASSLPVSFGTGQLFTLGQVHEWWADAVDERLTAQLLSTWAAGYRATSDVQMVQGSFDAAGGYVANVRDRLVRTGTPLISDQAFNIVRVGLLEEMSRGSATDTIARRIASDLDWRQPDAQFWEGRRDEVRSQLDGILDRVGPPGSPEREAMRLNDPQVRELQRQNSEAVRRLDADESTWRTRARAIARTETTGAFNGGAVDAAIREGQQVKVWLAQADDRTRDSHLQAAGQCVAVDGEFEVGDSVMIAPGVGGSAEEVVNCRCTLLFADSCENAARMVEPAAEQWDLLRDEPVVLSEDDRGLTVPVEDMPDVVDEPVSEGEFRVVGETPEEADAYGNSIYEDAALSLSEDEQAALRVYQGPAHEDMNNSLRFGTIDESTARLDQIRSIDAAIENAPPLPEDVTLYRGINDDVASQLANGVSEFTDNGFLSTSLRSGAAEDFGTVMEIRAPAGTKGFYMNSNPRGRIGPVREESELLLARGQTLKVVGREGNRLIVDIVGSNPLPLP